MISKPLKNWKKNLICFLLLLFYLFVFKSLPLSPLFLNNRIRAKLSKNNKMDSGVGQEKRRINEEFISRETLDISINEVLKLTKLKKIVTATSTSFSSKRDKINILKKYVETSCIIRCALLLTVLIYRQYLFVSWKQASVPCPRNNGCVNSLVHTVGGHFHRSFY